MRIENERALILCLCMGLGAVGCERPQQQGMKQAAATRVYVAGFPAVEIARTRMVFTNVQEADAKRAPVNQFVHGDRLVTAADREVVTPNNDTPYSIAFLDLSTEPLVLHVPDFGERYFTVPFLSAYHQHFASVGHRSEPAKGEQAFDAPEGGDFLITGPGWNGQVPVGMRQVRSPTNDVWIIMRPLVDGPDDMPALMDLKREMKLVPLSRWEDTAWAPASAAIRELDPEAAALGEPLTGLKFFEVLGEVVKNNPPREAEEALAQALAEIGMEHGYDPAALSEEDAAQLIAGAEEGIAQIRAQMTKPPKVENGWMLPDERMGPNTKDPLLRASLVFIGLGMMNPEEAVYPMANVDAEGDPLSGAREYTLHFDKDQLPPVSGFWSLTMYGEDKFLVDNPLNRYSLGDRADLSYGEDGSLTLYLQRDNPGPGKEANWLPAPEGAFYVVLRLYLPSADARRGDYLVPAIQAAD